MQPGSAIMLGELKQGWKISNHYVMFTNLKVEKPRLRELWPDLEKMHQVDHDKLSDDLQLVADRSYDDIESGLAD